ncbi:MAG: polysaccharide deacetylase family protein [Magnetococcales bacterium]|nr:polysaccharide deacetylase family protein [Magnetococcales bacterium]
MATLPPASDWPVLQRAVENAFAPPAPARSKSSRIIDSIIPASWNLFRKKRFPNAIYVLTYHSVVDPGHREMWEQCYRKGETTVVQLHRQLEFMMRHMTPVALSSVPQLWAEGGLDRPCFVVTFDDGMTNNRTHAHAIVRSLGITPTVFVCSEFARQRQTFFRVLAAVLVQQGYASRLAANLRASFPQWVWPDDGEALFNATKGHYCGGAMVDVIDATYRACLGDPRGLAVHLDRDGVAYLAKNGWEIGNHTRSHHLLAWQTREEVVQAIQGNADDWREEGIPLIDFIAYPIGRARDVGPDVWQAMQRFPHLHGLFCNGGVNFSLNRCEWMRFSFGRHTDPDVLEKIINQEVQRTRIARATLPSSQEGPFQNPAAP